MKRILTIRTVVHSLVLLAAFGLLLADTLPALAAQKRAAARANAAPPTLSARQHAIDLVATNSEAECLQILQSNASLTEKDAACARLKVIGTDRSVPALAA